MSTYLSYHGQNPRLGIVVSVSTDAEVDLLWVRVIVVRIGQLVDAARNDASAALTFLDERDSARVGRRKRNATPCFWRDDRYGRGEWMRHSSSTENDSPGMTDILVLPLR